MGSRTTCRLIRLSPNSGASLASQPIHAQLFGRIEQGDTRREQSRQSLNENDIEPDQLLGGSLENIIDELLDGSL